MSSFRSGGVDSLQIRKELVGNVLPTNREVIEHFFHVRQLLMVTDTKFSKKIPTFNDVKDVVIRDVVDLRRKGSLPVIVAKSIHKKLKMLHQRYEVARKLAKKRQHSIISEEAFLLNLAAACMLCSEVPKAHWRNIDNNNRATERYIGKLKSVVQNKIRDSSSHPSVTDIRIRAFLCNMD